jgi:nucleotide-binding universal stress UspA family protein
MGSVTDKVVRQALSPVLIVRALDDEVTSAAPKLARVVLPLDGSYKSHIATAHAVEMAKDLGVGITLLRSISPMAYGDTLADYVPTMYDDLAGEIESDVRDFLVQGAQGAGRHRRRAEGRRRLRGVGLSRRSWRRWRLARRYGHPRSSGHRSLGTRQRIRPRGAAQHGPRARGAPGALTG